MTPVYSDRVLPLDKWLETLKGQGPILFLGDDVAPFQERIIAVLGDHAFFGSPAENLPRAAHLGWLGLQRWHEEGASESITFAPEYLQLTEAEATVACEENTRGGAGMDQKSHAKFRPMYSWAILPPISCGVEHASFAIPWTRQAFYNELVHNQFARYTVAQVDGKLIGYCGMWLIIDEAHITNIALLPEYRGKGIGKELLIYKMAEAKLSGAGEHDPRSACFQSLWPSGYIAA